MSLESRYHIVRSKQTLLDYVMYELFLCHISCKNPDSTSWLACRHDDAGTIEYIFVVDCAKIKAIEIPIP